MKGNYEKPLIRLQYLRINPVFRGQCKRITVERVGPSDFPDRFIAGKPICRRNFQFIFLGRFFKISS